MIEELTDDNLNKDTVKDKSQNKVRNNKKKDLTKQKKNDNTNQNNDQNNLVTKIECDEIKDSENVDDADAKNIAKLNE